jgi:hypothetical protein
MAVVWTLNLSDGRLMREAFKASATSILRLHQTTQNCNLQAEQHAAVVARSPLELKVGDLKDIVCLFEYAFAAKTLPTAEAIALNRLRALLRVLVKEAA